MDPNTHCVTECKILSVHSRLTYDNQHVEAPRHRPGLLICNPLGNRSVRFNQLASPGTQLTIQKAGSSPGASRISLVRLVQTQEATAKVKWGSSFSFLRYDLDMLVSGVVVLLLWESFV